MGVEERTFEEIAGQELSRLYSAALFMCGGSAALAQDCIVDALGRAASEYPGPFLQDAASWLEERVVLFCLDSDAPRRPLPARAGRMHALSELVLDWVNPMGFYEAAAQLPGAARAAVWLVMFRRRRYADVAALLGVSRDELLHLLEYRDEFIDRVARRKDRAARGGT